MEADLIGSVPARISEREQILVYLWSRVEAAWSEENTEEAQEFHRAFVAFEAMSDDDVAGSASECVH